MTAHLERGRAAAQIILRVRAEGAQILPQIPVLHELHEDEGGLALAHHAQQLHHVGGVDLLHDARLVEEFDALAQARVLRHRLHRHRDIALWKEKKKFNVVGIQIRTNVPDIINL
jgi:hypothetical protein